MGITLGLRAQTVVEYVHTDALGTPVAITNAAGTVIERSEYEPYGQLINRPLTDGPGFTGHVQDAATGLTYMQQRYYDPAIGRFLSVDPVTANSGTGANFNRYWYANNNPYRFTDPDGRLSNDCLGSFCDRYRDSREQQCEMTCVQSKNKERKKEGRPNGTADLGTLGNTIKEFVDSDSEKEMFDHYWLARGAMKLSESDFKDIVGASEGLPVIDSYEIGSKNGTFFAHKFDFYSNPKYDAGIGSGWIVYSKNGSPVGFYDRYDFNAKSWGVRSTTAEIKTRAVNIAGWLHGAEPYEITYGESFELP